MIFGALERRAQKLESFHPSEPGQSWLVGSRAYSGIEVGPSNALTFGAFLSGVQIICNLVASMPLKLRRRIEGGSMEAREHPKFDLMHSAPNSEQNAYTWRHQGQMHCLTHGNFYAQIQSGRDGTEVVPLLPNLVEMRRAAGRVIYIYDGDIDNPLLQSEVLHVFALSFNGLKGISIVDLDREGIGLGLAAQRSGASFFGRGMQFGGALLRPEGLAPLSEEDESRVVAAMESKHRGPDKAGGWIMLQEGIKPHSIQFSNEDAQYIESRKMSIGDMARLLNLPLYLFGVEEAGQAYAAVEAKNKDLLTIALNPWLVAWEQELNRKLLTAEERRGGYYYEFVRAALLQATTRDRYDAHRVGIQSSFETPNDARRAENMNRSEAPGSDSLWAPINYAPIEQIVRASPAERALYAAAERGTLGQIATREWQDLLARESREPQEGRTARSLASRRRLRETFLGLIESSASRLVTAEVKAIRRQVERLPTSGEAAFRAWAETFFRQHEEFARTVLAPVLLAYLRAITDEAIAELDADAADFNADLLVFADEYVQSAAARHAGSGRGQIEALLREAETLEAAQEAIFTRLDEWSEKSAGKMANVHATQAAAAGAIAAWSFFGVTRLVMRTIGQNCPFCRQLDGVTVEVGQPVLRPGDTLESGDPAVADLVVKRVRRHPPWHRGCDCTVAPG